MRRYYNFIKSHNLVERIFDMLDYIGFFENNDDSIKKIKLEIKRKLSDCIYVETIAKYFEDQLINEKKNIELKCNLKDLISDLNYLKQYLSDIKKK